MKKAICQLRSISPYSQSRHVGVEGLPREGKDDYEKRTWRYRCHADSNGHVFIPPNVFSNGIKDAAKYVKLQIPGRGKETYTKNFDAGVMVTEGMPLPIKVDEVEGEWLFVPSDGKRGGGKRVMRCFPLIPSWSGAVEFFVLDDIITQEVFTRVLNVFGSLIGIGRFRPINRGYYGRFSVENIDWQEIEL